MADRPAAPYSPSTDYFHPDALLPFAPVSFRDFMLYEEHAIAAARGMVKRFMPGAWRFVSADESVFGGADRGGDRRSRGVQRHQRSETWPSHQEKRPAETGLFSNGADPKHAKLEPICCFH
jgi:hypothetical protein